MLSWFLFGVLALVSLVRSDCVSYGVDFQNGGSYFINSLSTSNFTAVSQFDGCTGTADIVLIDPDETSWECSDIVASANYTSVISTCPLLKDQMYSGVWTLVILADNGEDDSVAFQRTFTLTVGPQQTVTYTPTVDVSITTTPTSTVTSTSVETDTITLAAVTTTKSLGNGHQTVTKNPSRVTIITTSTTTALRTTTSFSHTVLTHSQSASCSVPRVAGTPDPTAAQKVLAIASSVLTDLTSATATSKATREKDRRFGKSNRRLLRRDPDAATTTVTDTITSEFITSTLNVTASATTVTVTATSSTTLTITPAVVTITATPTTVTAVAPSRTIISHTTAISVYIKTATVTARVAIKVTPTALAASCSAAGGSLS